MLAGDGNDGYCISLGRGARPSVIWGFRSGRGGRGGLATSIWRRQQAPLPLAGETMAQEKKKRKKEKKKSNNKTEVKKNQTTFHSRRNARFHKRSFNVPKP